MPNNQTINILAINPGFRYLGFAVLVGQELRDWGIRVIKKRSPQQKLEFAKQVISSIADQHKANVLAVKSLNPSRSSANLDQLASEITALARSKGLQICRYSLERVEASLCGSDKATKAKLATHVCEAYPFLSRELERERASRHPYHTRMFEAVALGLACLRDLNSL